MARLNWTDFDDTPALPEPGIYTCRITAAEERVSKAGDAYFNVTLSSTELDRVLCYDVIMLEGRGASLGYVKLKQLGFGEDTEEISDLDLVNLGVIVMVEVDEYKGNRRLQVAMTFEDPFRNGYAPASAYEELKDRLVLKREPRTPPEPPTPPASEPAPEGGAWPAPDDTFDEVPF